MGRKSKITIVEPSKSFPPKKMSSSSASSHNKARRTSSSSSDEERLLVLPTELRRDLQRTPQLDRDEIKLGRVLGRGAFCVVRAVRSTGVSLDDPTGFMERGSVRSLATSNTSTSEGSFSERKNKGKRSAHHHRCRYVLKEVVPVAASVTEPNAKVYQRAVVDLATEAKVLAQLDHGNIIKLRGTSTGVNGMGLTLVFDYLPETLTRRLGDWSQQDRATKGITGFVTRSRFKASQLLRTRLLVARDIASALQYLHVRNIIFRDVSLVSLELVVPSVGLQKVFR